MTPRPPIQVAAFYRFAAVADPQALASRLREAGNALSLKGSIIVAGEGANGTIAGAPEAVSALFDALGAEPGFEGLVPRLHDTPVMPFARWKVKVKREIVTMGVRSMPPAVPARMSRPPTGMR
jgi:UPF0176 protein